MMTNLQVKEVKPPTTRCHRRGVEWGPFSADYGSVEHL